MGDVIPIRSSISSGIETEATAANTGFRFEVTAEPSAPKAQRRLSLEEFYPEPTQLEPELLTARSLLKEYLALLDLADTELADQNNVAADEYSARAHLLLPELFCCRELGDGFATVVLAMFHSVANLRGQPLSGRQIQSLREAASTVSEEPYISFERSVSAVSKLETVGLSPDPERLGHVQAAFGTDEDDE